MFKRINWRYALGEIAIVIIGITIAFSLNKWAERSKDQNSRAQYLESLLVDLGNEIAHLNDNIGQFQAKTAMIQSLFPYLFGKTEGRDSMAHKVFELANIIHFHPHDITYRTLINSGDLGLFDDFELRKALENHYADHVLIDLDYQRQVSINDKYFGSFMIHNMDYSKVRQGDYSFMDDQLLKNIVQSLYGTCGIAITSSQQGIERCETLKGVLEEELK